MAYFTDKLVVALDDGMVSHELPVTAFTDAEDPNPEASRLSLPSDRRALHELADPTGAQAAAEMQPAYEGQPSTVNPPDEHAEYLNQLAIGAVGGDRGATDQLMKEVLTMATSYCRGRLSRRQTATLDADDVAQEIAIAVINSLEHYQPSGRSFRAFIYAIAGHKVTDALRACGRSHSSPVASVPDAPSNYIVEPERAALDYELSERLGRLMCKLSVRHRDILLYRIALGLSPQETAELIGSTSGAVRVTQHRALNRLRGIISRSPDWDEPLPGMPGSSSGKATSQ